jgi:transcriptional regulator with XRE-family HTH domain
MLLVTGAQLRAARALVRMEQEKLAERSGVSAVTIRKLENTEGQLEGRLSTIRALQQALEQAGVEFIPSDDRGPGVRLREPVTA